MTTNESVVRLRTGLIEGERLDAVSVFRGVPYARPPVGPLRFRPPRQGAPWEGVRDARNVGPIAHQFPTDLEAMQGRLDLPQSEDCLTLNIWTPEPDAARRPVLVWIHGGAYLNGTGAAEWFDGTSFATRHDVVLVTINYRLAVFGYLHLAGLSPDEVGSGNCGLLDQIAALQWVADNIASFGGDPGNVTVFGESAGAMSVGVLLGTPAADGLFHRAILQSGAASNVTTAEDATSVAVAVLTALGLSPDKEGVTRLRTLPADDIMAAYGAVAMSHAPDMAAARVVPTFAPVVDGVVLPQEPLRAIREGASSSVPVMIGTNRDEMEIMRFLDQSIYDFGDEEIERRGANLFGELAGEALALYRGPGRGTTQNVWTAVDTDRTFLMPAIALAEAHVAAGGATWLYFFTWTTAAFGGRMGAVHTLEIPFVFNNFALGASPELTGGPPAHAYALGERMHRTWAHFARHGDPTNDGLPEWAPYEPAQRATMIFDTECAVVSDPQRDRRVLWNAWAQR
jgi:para-nitrobenzyl esterase